MGISLNYNEKLSLFKFIKQKKLIDKRFDIADYKKLEKNILKFKPDIIYHLQHKHLLKNQLINPLDIYKII